MYNRKNTNTKYIKVTGTSECLEFLIKDKSH